MSRCDVAVIGTSPACVFEMASLESRGLKTLMIDRQTRIGGAWGTIDLPVVGTVESGAHYLPAHPGVYEFYENVLGLPMDLLDPPPKYLLPRRVLGKTHAPWRTRWGSGVSAWDARFPRTWRSWRNALSPYYRMTREILSPHRQLPPMRYFRMGTIGLVERLSAFVEARGLRVMLGTTVRRIDIDTARQEVRLSTDQGDVVATKFILTSSVVLDTIHVDGQARPIPSEIVPLPQLHLVIEGAPVENLSFGQYVDSPHLRLSANVSNFLKPDVRARGLSLIANLVTVGLPHTEASAQAIVAEHRAHGLLDSRHELIAAHWTSHDTPHRQDDELAQVERAFAPYVGTLSTHAFGATMTARVPEWRRALNGDARSLFSRCVHSLPAPGGREGQGVTP